VFHDTLASPGAGDVVIRSVPGNDVTFAAEQYYDGSTTIEPGAVLRLGSGEAGGDGGLMTDRAFSQVINDGRLVAQNADEAVSLSRLGGSGSFTQDGQAGTVFRGETTYTGRTTVARGTLTLEAGSLSRSSGVRLASADATLDLRAAGDQALRHLDAAEGATILMDPGASLRVAGERVDLSGDVVIDGTPFAVGRAGSQVRLTALPAGTVTERGTPAPTATPTPHGGRTAPAAGDDERAAATESGGVAGQDDGPASRAWGFGAAGAALVIGAIALSFTRINRRPRSPGAAPGGPGGRRRRRSAPR
jgi:hypothetical protein